MVEFIPPAKFAEYKVRAEEMGFVHVASGPLVRLARITRTNSMCRQRTVNGWRMSR